jgi:hypothetical protein
VYDTSVCVCATTKKKYSQSVQNVRTKICLFPMRVYRYSVSQCLPIMSHIHIPLTRRYASNPNAIPNPKKPIYTTIKRSTSAFSPPLLKLTTAATATAPHSSGTATSAAPGMR